MHSSMRTDNAMVKRKREKHKPLSIKQYT